MGSMYGSWTHGPGYPHICSEGCLCYETKRSVERGEGWAMRQDPGFSSQHHHILAQNSDVFKNFNSHLASRPLKNNFIS